MTVLRLRAGPKTSYSRRLFVLLADSQIVRVYDAELYGGLPQELEPYVHSSEVLPVIQITVSEYKRLLKRYG